MTFEEKRNPMSWDDYDMGVKAERERVIQQIKEMKKAQIPILHTGTFEDGWIEALNELLERLEK